MFLIKIFYSIFFILMWMWIIKYRRNVKSWTGNFYLAEHYIGNGGTYMVLILCGLWFMFYWMIYPFWWMELLIWK